MSWPTAVAAIRARLEAQWTTTPVAWQNEHFDKPDPPTAWVYAETIGGDDDQRSIGAPGANLFRRRGVIFLHVFVPTGTGDTVALTHAQTLGAIFRGKAFGGVTCEGASIGGGESGDDDGNWWRRSVSIAFDYDEEA
jgi:hypothetical protein